ncbi:MAG: RagB/SusD family nutrient uptake outer membrane protein [Saprospiraceae bacterium]|nr:RagB/SusD family nutrient uptake outer membrane protein [Saprospiraceae bacterium]
MKKFSFQYILLIALMGVAFSSCFNDLNTVPLDDDEFVSEVVFSDPASYKRVLAKLYAGLAVSGQQGPAGRPDIGGIDEGFSTYLRQYFKIQELPTDEAVIAWNDGNIQDYTKHNWDSNNEFVTAMYNRIFYQISLCNEYLRETTDAKLDERGASADIKNAVKTYRAEARFLRALSYWHALDLFRNVPFVTEDDKVGNIFPIQTNANDLFAYLETELKAIESDLAAPKTNEYGRADQAAAWMLLAKLYLNAEVYTGTKKYSEAADYSKKVIDAGFSLEPTYAHLFMLDNENSNEIIFPVTFDGDRTKTWGGMTFIVHAAVGGSMSPAEFGIDGGWGGLRTTKAFVEKFPAVGGSSLYTKANGRDNLPTMGVPGAYQDWNPANPNTVLRSLNSDNVYEGYVYISDASKNEFKFTLNGGWDENYGDTGADGTLEPGGDNIKVSAAGYYRVVVNLNDKTYSVTPAQWGLIGDATPNGWDSDQNMTYDAAEGVWKIQLVLKKGEVKFRLNDDWGVNLGDDGKDGLLENNGANIEIPSAGNYLIKLYAGAPDYTFSIVRTSFDRRAMFFTNGQELDIDDISQFTNGYAITKYKNVSSTGAVGKNLTFPDTDFPMFRLADAYLMYAEAVLRGGNGSKATAVEYVNAVRRRAYTDTSGDIKEADLTLNFLLDERARELVWECQRRTDLVRFGKFTGGDYIWPWKGGVKGGVATEPYRDIYPIPASDLGSNTNLKQNPNY